MADVGQTEEDNGNADSVALDEERRVLEQEEVEEFERDPRNICIYGDEMRPSKSDYEFKIGFLNVNGLKTKSWKLREKLNSQIIKRLHLF